MTTIKEVVYFQEKYDPSFDYSQLFYFHIEDYYDPGDWNFVPAPKPGTLWHAFRTRKDHLQVLTLVAHSPGPGFSLDSRDPTVQLFREMMNINPLIVHELELNLFIGRSEARDTFYMRHTGPQVAITPLANTQDLADLLFKSRLGIEYPWEWDSAFPDGMEWWVSYFAAVEQSELQEAYNRLSLLHDWLVDFSNRTHKAARRFFSRKVSEK